ncbi:MAG: tol-pal system YbgF family protein [Phycisphaerae bacterium]
MPDAAGTTHTDVIRGLRHPGAGHPSAAARDAAKAPSPEAAAPLKDVWSRSGSKYRVRAVVLLGINVLLFAGVGSFAFWLRSGEVFAPTMPAYGDELAHAFRVGGEHGITLVSLLVSPINVQDVPMHPLIVGLLIAALISIPILVAILYRFWSSTAFIAVVGFIACMPWLAVTLIGSCIIASVRPFRLSYRFVSALLALLPAVLYLILAFRGGMADDITGRIDPVGQIKFIAPWVLAIVAAAVVFAVVLTLAKVVDYRPGAITPLLAAMFGLPVGLFERFVGRDELYYRILESTYDAYFADVDTTVGLGIAAERAWLAHPIPRPSYDQVMEGVKQKWQFALAADLGAWPYRSELARHQQELAARCDRFCIRFPDSRYAPNVLFLKARTMDMRVDPVEFRRTRWIRFHDDFPCAASRQTWRMVVENRPDSPLAAVGLLRLAQLDARAGDIARAVERLGVLCARFEVGGSRGDTMGAPLATATPTAVLERDPPEASLHIPLARVVLHARQLLNLIDANRDPVYGYDPLSGSRFDTRYPRFGMLDLIPRHEGYARNLQILKDAYPRCQLADNLDLEIAKAATTLPERIQRLERCVAASPPGDAMPEALFRLGVAYLSANRVDRADAQFDRLLAAHADTVWARQAVSYSRRVSMPAVFGAAEDG